MRDDPVSDQFSHVGYESSLSKLNMGSIFLVSFVVLPLLVLIMIILDKYLSICKPYLKCTKWVHSKIKSQLKEIFWNGIIAAFD